MNLPNQRRILICVIFTLAVQSVIAQEARQLTQVKPKVSDKRIALVIGNGAYIKAPPLKNPPNDARDMAATLKALGFDVTIGININQRTFKQLVREFGLKLKAGGSGLFYYAGHGIQTKGRNYLIPVDADIQSEAEVEDSSVDVGLVLNFMDDAQNGLNIVILDACRNNPFAKSFRSASGGLAQIDAPTGTLIAYATAPGNVASDGADQNGLYTSELLKQMRIPGQSATDMFMRVRSEVMNKTGKKQVPWEASSLIGSFYFSSQPKNTAGTPTGETPTEPKFDASAFELSYWETIKNSTDPADFQAYLNKFPNGKFEDLAKKRALPGPPLASSERLSIPTVDLMQEQYIQAVGGEAALKKLTTRITKGSFNQILGQSNLSLTFETYQKAPNKIVYINSGGTQQGFNGENGWVKNNRSGLRKVTGEQLALMKRQSDFNGLTKFRELYAKISFLRKDKVNGRDVYVFDAAPPEGKSDTLYFDAETALLLRLDAYEEAFVGRPEPTESYYEDYREVDGVKLPFTQRQVGSNYTITIKIYEVKHNIPIDDAKFDGPSKK